MNKSLDLVEILKDCPKGTKLYSPIYGEVILVSVNSDDLEYPICVEYKGPDFNKCYTSFTIDGKLFIGTHGSECILFPSRKQHDWSTFTKLKFNPKTFKPFDKVLVKTNVWNCELFSYINHGEYPFVCINDSYKLCIPYNNDTKYLVGTSKEAPEYYRYWED